jgi:hypothetical protein
MIVRFPSRLRVYRVLGAGSAGLRFELAVASLLGLLLLRTLHLIFLPHLIFLRSE